MGTVPRRVRTVLLLAPLLLAGCVTTRSAVVRETRPIREYDALFPRFIEVCATSQINPLFAGAGGPAGHAVLYLKGVCRDADAAYPRVKLCDPATTDLADPESGTGVTVDRVLRNVNWLAVPGETLFFYGGVGRFEPLDRGRLDAAVDEAEARGVYQGVEIHPEFMPPGPAAHARREASINHFLGTDFALSYGRSAYCVRFPVPEAALGRTVAYLDGLNDAYAAGRREYRWSGVFDNCAHVLHNGLAAAGFWRPQSVNSFILLQAFSLSIPVDQFSQAALIADAWLENPKAIYDNDAFQRLLLTEGWLPFGHGVLFRVVAVHQRNEMYDTKLTLFSLTDLLGFSSRRVAGLIADARFTDLEINLLSFQKRYERLLAIQDSRLYDEPEEGEDYARFRAAYFDWVERQLRDAKAKLALLYGRREAAPWRGDTRSGTGAVPSSGLGGSP